MKWFYSIQNGEFLFIICNKEGKKETISVPEDYIFWEIPSELEFIKPEMIHKLIQNALQKLKLQIENFNLSVKLELNQKDISRIIYVGQTLSTERNFDKLLSIILEEAMKMVGADGGSLYITETQKIMNQETKYLRFKKSVLDLNPNEFLLPIDTKSIAGYTACSGKPLIIDDVYSLSDKEPYRFNPEYDIKHHYISRSMMVIPMINYQNDVTGVIQLINKRLDPFRKLTYEEMRDGYVLTFNSDDVKKILALAGQAAVAIENYQLIQNINNLFDHFVKASVIAIEQRDPTTSGHSFRVADYAVALAEAINKTQWGKLKNLNFSYEQIRELRYASLLHDFGKVGVREKVLVKEKKLYKEELEIIRWRFLYYKKYLENETLKKKLELLKNNMVEFQLIEHSLDEKLKHQLKELDEMLEAIELANEPSVVETNVYDKLEKITYFIKSNFQNSGNHSYELLKDNELLSLYVRRGNLTQEERLEIESHVTHTYKFLIQIPWTRDLKNIPEIAYAHHEKLDGSGYPLGLKGEEILPQSRMMTIADIFDALTAPDRPYKKSLSAEKSLDILKWEAREGKIDGEMLNIFIEAKIYEIFINRT